MTNRVAFAMVVVLGCDASLGVDPSRDAAAIDAPRTDAAVDAGIDARPCTGGDAAAVAPDGSCLVHFLTPATYVDARTACAAIDAHLAYLKSAPLDTFAESFIGTVDTWIGGNDMATEGSFQWDDGTAFAFTAWNLLGTTPEPNNGNGLYEEDCVIIAGARTDKLWDDRPCAPTTERPMSGSYTYLCQY